MISLPFKNLKWHIAAWTGFIGYEIALARGFLSFGELWDYSVHYILHIGLFYFNAYVVLGNAFRGNKKRYGALIAMVIGELVFYVGAKYMILYAFSFFHIQLIPPFTNNTNYIVTGLFRATFFLGLSTGYWFAMSSLQKGKQVADLENARLLTDVENRRLEKVLLATENAYLKSQINPHFLLNTLNFLYNSVSRFSDKIADSVMSLSEIMHYALTESDKDGKVMLTDEIQHIQNYLNLNQARFSQTINIDFTAEGDISGKRIIPLVLITLVENVLKYGVLLDPLSPAKIHLSVTGERLTFLTKNEKKPKTSIKDSGIGIQNIKNRLAHYQYTLEINESDHYYISLLNIEL